MTTIHVIDGCDGLTPDMLRMKCVPLCAADKAYGGKAPWWKHEPLCPAFARRERPDG